MEQQIEIVAPRHGSHQMRDQAQGIEKPRVTIAQKRVPTETVGVPKRYSPLKKPVVQISTLGVKDIDDIDEIIVLNLVLSVVKHGIRRENVRGIVGQPVSPSSVSKKKRQKEKKECGLPAGHHNKLSPDSEKTWFLPVGRRTIDCLRKPSGMRKITTYGC